MASFFLAVVDVPSYSYSKTIILLKPNVPVPGLRRDKEKSFAIYFHIPSTLALRSNFVCVKEWISSDEREREKIK